MPSLFTEDKDFTEFALNLVFNALNNIKPIIYLMFLVVEFGNLMISNIKVNTYSIKPSTTPASRNPSKRNFNMVSDDDSANAVSSSNFSK